MTMHETLQALAQNIDGLLIAGCAHIHFYDVLRACQQTLASAGAQVPALARLADQIDKITAAAPDQSVRELLELSVIVKQLQSVLVAVGATDGELTPPAPLPPLTTPLPAYEFEPLFFALTRETRGRTRVPLGEAGLKRLVKESVKRDMALDLRLVTPWINRMLSYPINEFIQAKVIPGLLGDIKSAGALEAMRCSVGYAQEYYAVQLLEHLVKANSPRMRELLVRSINEGSDYVRQKALAMLGELDPVLAEPIALARIRSDSSHYVRATAAEVLGKSCSEEAFNALLEATAGSVDIHSLETRSGSNRVVVYVPAGIQQAAGVALGKFVGADYTRRLLDLIFLHEPTSYYGAVYALRERFAEAHNDVRVLPWLRAVWADCPNALIRAQAGKLILAYGDREGLELLARTLEHNDERCYKNKTDHYGLLPREVALRAIFQMGAKEAYERLACYFQPDWLLKQQGGWTAAHIVNKLSVTSEIDPRWIDLLVNLLLDERIQGLPCDILVPWLFPEEVHLARANSVHGRRMYELLISFLGKRRDARALPALLFLLDNPPNVSFPENRFLELFKALELINDNSIGAKLRDWGLQNRLQSQPYVIEYLNLTLQRLGQMAI